MQNKIFSFAKYVGLVFGFIFSSASIHVAAEPAKTPLLLHQGDRILIPAHSPLRQRLRIETANQLAQAHAVALPAQVEADPARTLNIVAPVTGKLLALKVGLGDHVQKGQPLLLIASGDFAQAASDQQKADDMLQLTKKAVQRQRGVQQAGAGAQKDLEQAESAYIQALAEYNRAHTRFKSLSNNARIDVTGRSLTVLAPISGSITTLSVAAGQTVNDTNMILLTIANLDHVWVTANVPENMLSSISPKQAVDIRLAAYPDQQFQGTVAFMSDVIQADSRRSLVRIGMANRDGKLKPNMYATASFALAQPEQVVVPSSALLMNNDDTTVFVEVAPWSFQRRTVETGYEEKGEVRIQHGLKVGERIITVGGVLLND